MTILETHIVHHLEKPQRLQEYAVGIFITTSTKSAIKKAIKKKLLLVNDQECSTGLFIHGGEKITLLEEQKKHKPFDLNLHVLFEDEYLAVIDKPAGVSVSGNSFVTIDNALSRNLKKSNLSDAVKPRPVHRLDYPTSGALLIGKTSNSIQKLNDLFELKKVDKTYYAITIGKMNSKGEISIPVDEKEASSIYQVIQTVSSDRFDFLNLVKLSPQTGRRHQLRKHLSGIGNPILGDKEYGKQDLILKGKGLYLHAHTLKFQHPFTKQIIEITSTLPKKFQKIF